jgi:hypothetical protein
VKKPKLVIIEWLDSAQPLPAWRHLDDLPELEAVRCFSVGWLVAEDKSVKLLAPNIGDFDSGGSKQGSGFIRIPVAAVVRQRELVERG